MGPPWDTFDFLADAMYLAGQGFGYADFIRPPLIPFLTSLFFRTGFTSEATIFIIDGGLFVFGVLGLYLFLKQRFDNLQSFLGALIFVSFPVILLWVGTGYTDVAGTAISIWSLYLTVLAVDKNPRFFYLSFPIAALAFLTRFPAAIIIFPMFLYILINREQIKSFKHIALGITAAFLILAPIFLFFNKILGNPILPFVNFYGSTIGSGTMNVFAFNSDPYYYISNALYGFINMPLLNSNSLLDMVAFLFVLSLFICAFIGIFLYFNKIVKSKKLGLYDTGNSVKSKNTTYEMSKRVMDRDYEHVMVNGNNYALNEKNNHVTGDLSTDKTYQLTNEYQSSDQEIPILKQPMNLGVGGVSGTGVEKADGDLIVTTGTDLSYYPSFIPKFLRNSLKSTYIKFSIIMLLLIIFLTTFNRVNYIFSDILFLLLSFAVYNVLKSENLKYLDLDFLFLSWIISFLIFNSVFQVKVYRYFIPMASALAYFIILGWSEFSDKINLKFKKLQLTSILSVVFVVAILFSSFSFVFGLGHDPLSHGQNFQIHPEKQHQKFVITSKPGSGDLYFETNDVNELINVAGWLKEHDPGYKNKVIYSDYFWPQLSWFLQTYVRGLSDQDKKDVNAELTKAGADYYINIIYNVNLKDYVKTAVFKTSFGDVTIYKRI